MSDKKGLVQEFKEFIAGGNMLELAVAVILGAAIAKVITAFVDGIVMQVVAAIVGKPSFDEVKIRLTDDKLNADGTFKEAGAQLAIGTLITQIIALILVGLVLFAMIKGYNKMKAKQAAAAPPAGPSETDLLTEIRDALKARN
jgi:large conductance mechanosensitive channel